MKKVKKIIGWFLIGSVSFFVIGGMIINAIIDNQVPAMLGAFAVIGAVILGVYLVAKD